MTRVDELQEQEERLSEIQSALYHARVLMDGLHYERMDPREIHAAAYFAAIGLEHLADSVADDAVKFVMRQRNDLDAALTEKGNAA